MVTRCTSLLLHSQRSTPLRGGAFAWCSHFVSHFAPNAPTESCRCTTRIPWYHQNPAHTHRILFALTAWNKALGNATSMCLFCYANQICLRHNTINLPSDSLYQAVVIWNIIVVTDLWEASECKIVLSLYHTRPCAYQLFQGCACKVCETHRLKVKLQKRRG